MKSFRARPRHPVTGKTIVLRARSKDELARKLATFEEARERLLVKETLAHPGWKRTLTVREATRAYLARPDLSPETRKSFESFLRSGAAPIAKERLAALTAPVVKEWLDGARVGHNTRARHWRMLAAIARFAQEKGWLPECPWGSWRPLIRRVKPRLRDAARSVDELRRLWQAARELDQERTQAGKLPYLEAKLLCAACLGLRQKELRLMCWPDLDPQGARVFVREAKAPGGVASVRPQAAPWQVFDVLYKWQAELSSRRLFSAKGPIFVHPSSRPGSPRPYHGGEVFSRKDLRAIVARAGFSKIESWSVHSLRDTFVTLEQQARGNDLAAVAQRARHASPSTVVRYLREARGAPLLSPGFDIGEVPA